MSAIDVLIIEDNDWLAGQYGRVLKAAGFSSRHAPNALVAIDLVDEVLPRAIILDMLLAVTTGITLLHELRSHADLARLPVIVVTNLADELKLEDLQPYGVTQLLDKTTMHPDDIATAVKRELL